MAAVEYIQVWKGGKLCYSVQASPACAHVEHPIRQAAYADSAPRSASWKNANGVSQMVPSDWSGRIRTRELEEEALKNDWTIETNQGGRSTAISRMDHTTGATKI